MSEIKVISCQGYPVDDNDVDLVKFSVTVVKRVCKKQKIAYRPHEKAEFEDWLVGVYVLSTMVRADLFDRSTIPIWRDGRTRAEL